VGLVSVVMMSMGKWDSIIDYDADTDCHCADIIVASTVDLRCVEDCLGKDLAGKRLRYLDLAGKDILKIWRESDKDMAGKLEDGGEAKIWRERQSSSSTSLGGHRFDRLL
jgi:hypothetical protein